ncbi:MAG: DUF4435 domain-containing protein [Saprospiraceae bacterium]|nr:DUF4435 domain-containing protein [Saprospiraceae bacterium]
MRKSDYTSSDKLTELRLDMSHPKSKGIVFILLEGDADVRFYRKFFRQNTCKMEEVTGGKIKLEEILSTLNQRFPLIIGIRDADFLHLETQKNTIPNLFFTDYHDLEIMLINSSAAFSAVIHEFSTIDKQEHTALKLKFLEALKLLSYLRWYNDKVNSGLRFKGLNLGNIFDIKNFILNPTLLLSKVRALSQNATLKDDELILLEIQEIENDNHDLLQLTNGHDMMKIMSAYFSSLNKKGINDTDLASVLRIAFSLEDFKMTQLYKDTLEWAVTNKQLIHV